MVQISKKTLYAWWKRKIANPITKIDDNVKHNFQQITWPTWVQRDKGKLIDRSGNTEKWTAVKGFWDGTKDNGESGCGLVIKGVDKDKWVTISKIAVPLRYGHGGRSNGCGVSFLTEILDLVLNKCLSVQNINWCIDKILDKQ